MVGNATCNDLLSVGKVLVVPTYGRSLKDRLVGKAFTNGTYTDRLTVGVGKSLYMTDRESRKALLSTDRGRLYRSVSTDIVLFRRNNILKFFGPSTTCPFL